MEHVFLFAVVSFILYHLMSCGIRSDICRRDGFNVGGQNVGGQLPERNSLDNYDIKYLYNYMTYIELPQPSTCTCRYPIIDEHGDTVCLGITNNINENGDTINSVQRQPNYCNDNKNKADCDGYGNTTKIPSYVTEPYLCIWNH